MIKRFTLNHVFAILMSGFVLFMIYELIKMFVKL